VERVQRSYPYVIQINFMNDEKSLPWFFSSTICVDCRMSRPGSIASTQVSLGLSHGAMLQGILGDWANK
jgi:hypothetical protein